MRPMSVLVLSLLASATAASAQGAQSAPTASGSTCGRISVFDVAPRAQGLYRAKLLNLDGQAPGPSGARSFRVQPGPHELEVAEAIDNDQFNDLQLQQRVRNADRYKVLKLDVQPGVTYSLAVKLIEARRNYILDESYWEPVIFQQVNEACR